MILTTINDVPLFSTLEEALSWGSDNGLNGYHTHTAGSGTKGYMGGYIHKKPTRKTYFKPRRKTSTQQIIRILDNSATAPPQQTVTTTTFAPIPIPQPQNTNNSSGSGGGGYSGGSGGY